MSRREFPRHVYAAIIQRATNARGLVTCEGCGLVLGRRPYHVDHTIPDALFADKSRTLTAADGKLLGVECCHKPKTKADVAQIAKTYRQRDRDQGRKKRRGAPMLGSRASKWKRKMDGTTVPR